MIMETIKDYFIYKCELHNAIIDNDDAIKNAYEARKYNEYDDFFFECKDYDIDADVLETIMNAVISNYTNGINYDEMDDAFNIVCINFTKNELGTELSGKYAVETAYNYMFNEE